MNVLKNDLDVITAGTMSERYMTDIEDKLKDSHHSFDANFQVLDSNNIIKRFEDISGLVNIAKITYPKYLDASRNNLFMNNLIENEYNNLNDKTIISDNEINNNNRHNEIYKYHYKKNKAQLNILYSLFSTIIIVILLTLLNKNYNNIFTNASYIIIVGIICGVFIIYLFYQLYDIFLKSDHNFDEYDYGINKNKISNKLKFSQSTNKKDKYKNKDKCIEKN